MKSYNILTINPGATSTKLALFRNETEVLEIIIRHSLDDMVQFKTVLDQYNYRKKLILDSLKSRDIDLQSLDVVVGRGGLLKPLQSGTYVISDAMISDLQEMKYGEHASNLGAILAKEIGDCNNIPSFIVDPVVVDELNFLSRVSGMPEIQRKSTFHALNQKSVAKRASVELGLFYENSNFIVAHLGSGISVGVHANGKVVDVNDALYGDGPFSPERAGGVPPGDLIRLCFSGAYTEDELLKKLTSSSGLAGYLHTNDAREVVRRIESGDKYAELIYKTLAYQIAKEIGAAATVVSGMVNAIIITGGLAYEPLLIEWIVERISFINTRILIYPGEDEMKSMAEGALRILRKFEEPREYR